MTDVRGRWRPVALGGLFVVSIGLGVRNVKPFGSASVGPDAVAPVIEFQRLLAGRPVEGHLTQTSKPLFDAVFGPIYGLTGDWRPVVWAAIVAFALSVVLAAVLAYRIGGLTSAAFAAVAFLLSPILLVDLSLAYAITWMLLLLLVAGLAVTTERPRYAIAGTALMLAALARPEVLAVAAISLGALVVAAVWATAKDRPRPPRGAYYIVIAFLAIPILMVHDGLLFRDPFFWAKTALINSQGQPVRGLVAVVLWMVRHFLGQLVLLPLAGVAAWVLLSRRQWGMAIGLGGVVFGIAGFFIVSGARGIFLSSRYLAPIDLGLLFAAAVGVSALDLPALRRWLGQRLSPTVRQFALPMFGGLLVAMTVAPLAPLDNATRASVVKQLGLHANARRAFDAIRSQLGTPPTWRNLPPGQGFSPNPLVIVPTTLRAQAVTDLDLPLTEVAYSSSVAFFDPFNGKPGAGTIIYHDRIDDDPNDERYRPLEISQPTTIGAVRYVPILTDPAAGIWVVRVEDAPGS